MCATYPGCAIILTTAAEFVPGVSAAVGYGSNARVGASLFARNSLQYVWRPSLCVLPGAVCVLPCVYCLRLADWFGVF
jgi:hypothetical protein